MKESIFILLSILLLNNFIYCKQTNNSTRILNDTIVIKPIQNDYTPSEKISISPELMNRTQILAEHLFEREINSVLDDGPSNRLYEIFTSLLPVSRFNKKKTPKENVFKTSINRRIFTRQTAAAQQLIPQSPLFVRSQTQLGIQSSVDSRRIDAAASIALKVSRDILTKDVLNRKFDLDPLGFLNNVQAPNSMCPFKATRFCDANSRYSQIDGSCNNIQMPWLGKSETPYKRYMQPAYDDKINSPRQLSVTGTQLPSPRAISSALSNDNFLQDDRFTHLIAIFGQFLAHDITSAAATSDATGKILDCPCNNFNPSCLSMVMPPTESVLKMSCMRFTRSSSAFANFDCRLSHREQLNLLTSFIDATNVYGPNDARARELRSFIGGKLKTSEGISIGRSTLPQGQDGSCRNIDEKIKCFGAGDGRANENNALTGLHTLFMREHNRIATELALQNPAWDDEKLFNEARKIVIAEMQHIVYNEWLPAIIGWNTAALFDLVPISGRSYYSGYNPSVNPQLAGEFATAAFRFGHTLIRSKLSRFDGKQQSTSPAVSLNDIIFRPVEIYNTAAGGIDSILLGLVNDASSRYDPNVVDTLQNRLFEGRISDGTIASIDLVATNINRGRDHGIPDYNSVREKCGLKRATSFQDLTDTIPQDRVQVFQSIYQNVNDLDLYIAGLAESPARGALVGPTFGCLLANQFKDLKKGDRFYYENGPSPSAFSLNQLSEIKQISMSRIFCDNLDIQSIQPNAFMQPKASLNNKPIRCNWLPSIDLSKWKE